jgi:hypothetical protein
MGNENRLYKPDKKLGGIIMDIMKFLVVFILVIALNIALYLGTAILSNILFHKICLNKFEQLQNKIINSGKEDAIRKSVLYLTMVLFFIIITISKGFTFYSVVIMGIVMGFISPIIFNDKEEILYKQIHLHKGWIIRRKE